MDCNKQLHIKVKGPPVELCTVDLVIVIHTGFEEEQKLYSFFFFCCASLIISGHSYSSMLDLLCESSLTTRDNYTLLHTTLKD